MNRGVALLVIAKEPIPGRAKTRLTPPCTPTQAANLAAAALFDTLKTVARTPAARRVLVFEGDPRRWCPHSFDCIPQRGDGLAERLASAFEDVAQPALLVGMDTPQLTPALLLDGLAALTRPNVDAVLGPATDGGYWSIGLTGDDPPHNIFNGIPMSEPTTYEAQRARMYQLNLRLHEQPPLRDIDTIDDAYAAAAAAPASRFAAALEQLTLPVAA